MNVSNKYSALNQGVMIPNGPMTLDDARPRFAETAGVLSRRKKSHV